MFDTSALPIGGSTLLGLLAYAGLSVLAGQEIAEREVVISGWPQRCEAALKGNLEAQRQPAPPPKAKTDCVSRFGWLHRDVGRLCLQYNNPDLELPAEKAARLARAHASDLHNRRIEAAKRGVGSQCGCALRVYQRENLLGLGLYAGSARMISLPGAADREGGLRAALTQQCASSGGLGS